MDELYNSAKGAYVDTLQIDELLNKENANYADFCLLYTSPVADLDGGTDGYIERSRGESVPIHQLIAELGPASSETIPAEVKAKMVAMIQSAIENMVEK